MNTHSNDLVMLNGRTVMLDRVGFTGTVENETRVPDTG